jgi:serine/threonine protein kinase
MERMQQGHESGFDSQSASGKDTGSGSGSYNNSMAVPTILTSLFSQYGKSARDNSQYYNEHHQHQHHENHQPHEIHHEHHQPHRSGEVYSSSRTNPPRQSLTPPPRRARSHPRYEQHGRGNEDYNNTNAWASPRRVHSHHIHRPYPPHQAKPRRTSASAPVSPSSAFEAYPRKREYDSSGGGGGISPPPRWGEDHQHRRPPAPVSYICASARSCYPSTTLGKRICDEVRTMTEGTRLVPVARFDYHGEQPRAARGMVRVNLSEPNLKDSQQQQHQHRTDSHHHGHDSRHRHQNQKTIRLLNSAIEILETHSVLGRGTFSVVTSVTIKEPNRREQEHQHQQQHEFQDHPPPPHRNDHRPDRHHSRSPRGRRPRYYACKSIKEELLVSNAALMVKRSRDPSEIHVQSVEYCVLAASQLAYEAHVLSSLDHPNIVKMRGLDADGILGFEKRDHRGFFLLIDVVSETLDQKIDRWRSETAMAAGSRRRNHNQHDPAVHPDIILLRRQKEKLEICLQLASALDYIHDRRIVYRDLKPSNIGFVTDVSHGEQSSNGTSRVQLFDFGMSRELTPNHPTLTGAIGTMRYMAPEVCLESSYDCDCDIYSYSIVCWELWAQKVPFEDVATPDLYREHVCHLGYRPVYRPEEDLQHQHKYHHHHNRRHPPIQAVPNEILMLLSQGWNQDPKVRIRWPKTRNQLQLLETLVGLQLEERELSESTSTVVAAVTLAHASVHRESIGNFPSQGHHRHAPIQQAPSHHAHHIRSSTTPDWEVTPIHAENNNNDDDNDSHFSLREEDLAVDLGI